MVEIIKPTQEALELASRVLSDGGIVIYPTESSYAIGADATNACAVNKVRQIKSLNPENPMLVIIDSLETAEQYCYLTKEEKALAKKYMPGQLTICAKKKSNVPNALNRDWFSFRIPGNKVALELAKLFKKPITATSANRTKEKPAFRTEDIRLDVDLILDAGVLQERPPSTIVENGKVIRQGAVKV